MSLGRSPGVVTAAVSYLANRYERWNDTDQDLFATSGEYTQQGKRGDIEALVLFATHEVIEGQPEGRSTDYIDNRAGETKGERKQGESVPGVIRRVLVDDLSRVAGGRPQILLYRYEVDRRDLWITFERVAQVLHAVKPPGKVGKEVWINLTGGSNVLNLALQLAAALLGGPARLYYLLSENDKCLRHTTRMSDLGTERDRFWVEIPLLYLRLDDRTCTLLKVLEEVNEPSRDEDLLSRLKGHREYWAEFQELELNEFRRNCLLPLVGQQLINRVNEHTVTVGQQ